MTPGNGRRFFAGFHPLARPMLLPVGTGERLIDGRAVKHISEPGHYKEDES
jgi:hypothetical protein